MNTLRPIAAIALISLFVFSSTAVGAPSDGPNSRPGQDKSTALVQLKGDPLATSDKTKPPQGKKIDFDSATVKSYRASLSALRNDFKAWLRANAPGAKVTGEFDISLNALSLNLGGSGWRRSPPRRWCSAPNTRGSTIRRPMIPTWESSTPSRPGEAVRARQRREQGSR